MLNHKEFIIYLYNKFHVFFYLPIAMDLNSSVRSSVSQSVSQEDSTFEFSIKVAFCRF